MADESVAARGRREKARAFLIDRKVDALLLTDLHNVRYLTGFTGSNASLLLFRDREAILYTDPRYTVQAGQQVSCTARIVKGPLTKGVLRDIHRAGVRRIGVEGDSLTVARFEALKKDLPARAHLLPLPNLIGQQRMVKDEGEIARIRSAVTANSQALEAAIGSLRPGMTELEFAAEIDSRNREFGAEGPAFSTIVAAGERSALPHAHPGAARIGPGILLIDMGAFHEGYASDMTRMLHLGKPGTRYRQAYKAVLESQLAGVGCIRPGITSAKVDATVRAVLKTHGLDKEFVHSTGHGLGLEIHEPPRLGKSDKTRLQPGMVITIEPGIYIEGWGGIRIEDTVLVTAGGCEILTPTSKLLRQV